jgi:hypothetical protein
MFLNLKFYKIKILKNFLLHTNEARNQLLDELITNTTDPVLYIRRFRMLTHLAQYENQIIKKIQNFDTDNVEELELTSLINGLQIILNKSA